jgi:hypothetical protein
MTRRVLFAALAALPFWGQAPRAPIQPTQVCADTQVVVRPDSSIEVFAFHVDRHDLAKVLDAAVMTEAQRTRLAASLMHATEISVTFTSRRCVRGPA